MKEWIRPILVEVITSAILGELINKACNYLKQKCQHKEVKNHLLKLQTTLTKIQAVVYVAESKELQNTKLIDWLNEMKDATYDADDVLDTFAYNELEETITSSSIGHRFKRKFPALIDMFTSNKNFKELERVTKRLENLSENVELMLQLVAQEGELKHPAVVSTCRSSSLMNNNGEHNMLIGRNEETLKLRSMLLKCETGTNKKMSVVTILGIGGIGKTALAKRIFNDDLVKQRFETRLWVDVSESFDEEEIIREILEQAYENRYNGIKSLQHLQAILMTKLREKNILLVLDNVWNVNAKLKWERIFTPLSYGGLGSKILITTRFRKVATLVGTEKPILLKGLSEKDYWELFSIQAFGSGNENEHLELVNSGKKIAKKLKGSPLAAKSVGWLLKNNLSTEHWENISENNIWNLDQGRDDIMPVLKLSYEKLPRHLQNCFKYFSTLPRNWHFTSNDLIHLWMALGFINPKKGLTTVRIAREYFWYFSSMSVIELSGPEVVEVGRNRLYLINDLYHNLAVLVSSDEYMSEFFYTECPRNIRHLSLKPHEFAKLIDYPCVIKKLRTLIIYEEKHSIVDHYSVDNVFKKLESIRVIILFQCHIKRLPDSVGQLHHLRYLSLYKNDITVLPESISNLYHLRYLDVTGCPIEYLPMGMNNLVSLQLLKDTDGKLVSTLSCIGKLIHLKELCFSVGKNSGFHITELTSLNELEVLSIENIENVTSEDDACKVCLSDKKYLESLKLCWGNSSENVGTDLQVKVLEHLKPPPFLKDLELTGYASLKYPSWTSGHYSLSRLCNLKLINCKELNELPPLGILQSLVKVIIDGLASIEEVNNRFYGSGTVKFPSLRILYLRNMPKCTTWTVPEHEHAQILFPLLKKLEIRQCPKLTSIPSIPLSLKHFRVTNVGLVTLPEFSGENQDHTGLKSLCINCPNLECLGEWFLKHLQNLTKLETLSIFSFQGLDFTVGVLSLLAYLNQLAISSSPNIKLDCSTFTSSLQFLSISRTHHLTDSELSRLVLTLPALSRLSLRDCSSITTLPLAQLRQLAELDISECQNLALTTSREDHIVRDDIFVSPKHLRIDDPMLLKMLLSRESLGSLEVLEFTNKCKSTYFSDEQVVYLFRQLTGLHELAFQCCEDLQFLPPVLKLLPSMKKLCLVDCFLEVGKCNHIQMPHDSDVLPPSLKIIEIQGWVEDIDGQCWVLTTRRKFEREDATAKWHELDVVVSPRPSKNPFYY